MTRVLVVTNDFPPRPGGIQAFGYELVRRLLVEDGIEGGIEDVVVLTSRSRGARAFDAAQPFRIERLPYYPILPTPDVGARAAALVRRYRLDAVWFGAAAPLGLLAAPLRSAGACQVVATTHGHEAAWSAVPGARRMLARISARADVVTYLGDYTRRRLERAVPPATRLERLAPGVDAEAFDPRVDGSGVRRRHRLGDRPVVVCVSRLVPRKGQDALIGALPLVRDAVPDAALLLVGDGRDRGRLRRLAAASGVADDVVFTGAVDWRDLPAHFAAGDVFAMPCRTRRGGLDVEGLGIVFLEASASGLPVVAGNSGGAPDAVRDGETGWVVDGRDVRLLADRLVTLLTDRALAQRMGAAGRSWVERDWRWDAMARRLAGWLAGR
jgi:phosphatidyl-myo-inositol dimannoside synthase